MLLRFYPLIFCLLVSVLIIIYNFYLLRKKSSNFIYITISQTFFYVGISLLIVYVLFPIPFQKVIIENKFNAEKNYLLPYARIQEALVNSYYIEGGTKHIVIGSILYILKNIIIYFIISVLIFLRNSKKVIIIFTGMIIEITQFIIGFVIGLNYKSISTEDIILTTIGFTLGYIFVKKLFSLSQYLKKKSIIMNTINHYFIHKELI